MIAVDDLPFKPIRFVYVASPYTKGDVAVNVRASIDAANVIAENGYFVFCPLLTHFWHLVHPHPVEFWYAQDLGWLEKCDLLVRLPGESTGADAEVARARELGIPVCMGLDEFFYPPHRRRP